MHHHDLLIANDATVVFITVKMSPRSHQFRRNEILNASAKIFTQIQRQSPYTALMLP
jgi:malate/lactate dehydrogenase